MAIRLAKQKLGTVGDAMSEVVSIIDDTATVAEAAKTLTELQVTGAPVVDDERIVGVVSQTDLLAAEDPDTPVREVMTATVYAVRASDPLMFAVHLMVDQLLHRVIVVDEDGKLDGILTAMDVLRVISASEGLEDDVQFVDLRERD